MDKENKMNKNKEKMRRKIKRDPALVMFITAFFSLKPDIFGELLTNKNFPQVINRTTKLWWTKFNRECAGS